MISSIGTPDVLEDLKQLLSVVTEGHGAVVRIVLLDQHVAVEAAHFVDREHADASEGSGGDGKDLILNLKVTYIRLLNSSTLSQERAQLS